MKIILPGDEELAKRKSEQPKTFTCGCCGCVFEAINTEYKYEGGYRNEDTYACDCPTCNRVVYVYE